MNRIISYIKYNKKMFINLLLLIIVVICAIISFKYIK